MKRSVFCIACYDDENEAVGTDSYFPCDGRWSVKTCIERAKLFYNKKNIELGKDYKGFNIYFGVLKSNTFFKHIKL